MGSVNEVEGDMAKAGIVYVGTQDGLVIYSDPGGIGRWRRVGQALEGLAISAISAADALTLTLRVEGQAALRSEDGGQSFVPLEGDGPAPIGLQVATSHGPVDQVYPRLMGASAFGRLEGKQPVLVAAAAGGTMFFRSEDDGIHWQPAGLTGADSIGKVQVITPASYHIDTAWAGTAAGELLRSDDRGRSWAVVAREQAAILSLAVVRLV
jgi:hypothetical protein